jgi:hypothetical protein
MSLQEYLNEIKSINTELLLIRKTKSNLIAKYKDLQKKVVKILEEEKQPGVKYKDNVILLKEKKTYKHKSKIEKQNDAMSVLSKYGIREPQKLLSELDNAKHGQEIVQNSLKIIKKKQSN